MIEQGSKIENIWHIYHFSRECYNVAKYFSNPSTSEEKNVYQKDNSISFIQHLFFRMSIIELAKLTVKSQSNHYNIDKFLRELKETEIKELIKIWEEYTKKHGKLITTIRNLRNKFYAHSDEDRYDFFEEIDSANHTEIEALYSIIVEIIQKIYEFNGCTADINNFEFENGDIGILRNYAELYQLRMNDLVHNCNKISAIDKKQK